MLIEIFKSYKSDFNEIAILKSWKLRFRKLYLKE